MIFTMKSQDKLYRGKSARKLFPERANYERLTSPQNKKLFPIYINQESQNRQPQVEKPVVRIDVYLLRNRKTLENLLNFISRRMIKGQCFPRSIIKSIVSLGIDIRIKSLKKKFSTNDDYTKSEYHVLYIKYR